MQQMASIEVEVVYAEPSQCHRVQVLCQTGTTVEQAVTQSGLLATCGLKRDTLQVGVYAKLVQWADRVYDQDRIELYRGLIGDPKQIRRERAALK